MKLRYVKSVIKPDNGCMKLFHRMVPVPRNLYGPEIGGDLIWRISLPTAYDTCLPVSALATLLHRRGGGDSDLSTFFKQFESAYTTRDATHYFDQNALRRTFGLREVPGLVTSIENPARALESIFKILQNRKQLIGPRCLPCARPIKNDAFILILRRPNEGSQHAITVTCDGLWKGGKGFGFQDTQYHDQTIARYWKKMDTIDAFHTAFLEYLTRYDYTNATVQMICLEDV